MALNFTALSSDRVDLSSITAHTASFTLWSWIYLTSITNNTRVWGASVSSPTGHRQFIVKTSSPTNGLTVFLDRATGFYEMVSNASILSTNTWYFVAVTWDNGGGSGKIWQGTQTSAASDVTATASGGSGDLRALDGNYWRIGNSSFASPVEALGGRIASAGLIIGTALTQAQLSLVQYNPTYSPFDHEYLLHLGIHGSGGTGSQIDWSGNARNGTITGTTKADHAPLPIFPYSIIFPQLTIIVGTTVWGHVTGVTEDNVRTFAVNWTGTGNVISSGDNEKLELDSGEYMVSEMVETGSETVTLLQNEYGSGDDVLMEYRHGATQSDCQSASWNTYSAPFASLGFVQIRMTSTL